MERDASTDANQMKSILLQLLIRNSGVRISRTRHQVLAELYHYPGGNLPNLPRKALPQTVRRTVSDAEYVSGRIHTVLQTLQKPTALLGRHLLPSCHGMQFAQIVLYFAGGINDCRGLWALETFP